MNTPTIIISIAIFAAFACIVVRGILNKRSGKGGCGGCGGGCSGCPGCGMCHPDGKEDTIHTAR